MLNKPKNDCAKCLFILQDAWVQGVSMADVLTKYDSTFYKFQSRLGEILEAHPKLQVEKTDVPYTSRINGKKKHYFKYRLMSPQPYIVNLYNLINEKGLTGSISETSHIVPEKKDQPPKYTQPELI